MQAGSSQHWSRSRYQFGFIQSLKVWVKSHIFNSSQVLTPCLHAITFLRGAVLSQEQKDGKERVIAYASRALSKAERKYSVTRQELLTAVTFIHQFCQFFTNSYWADTLY